MVIVELRDITDQQLKQHRLSVQNWALSAFSIAVLALGRARTAEGLLQSIGDAITAQSAYVLAWVGIAETGPERKIRVADIADAIGREMGWPDGRLQGLRMAAMVHDIGKISIQTEILIQSTGLTAAEYLLVKRHPETGYAILKDIPFAWPIAEIVRQHHEKQDGSGYPRGLKGDEILPEARVLTVADIVEAMAADRPYRGALGLEIALAEIESQAGKLLDAEAVGICAKLFRERRLIIPELHLD
jgi:response regulator RpfG family c-di-GMP phosphodiesterase